ncbi:MAG: DNA-3-methyladenine glycosylase 2 family protein [Rhodobacteraceae bacterium]|nr:DNA-3-methyladenine glycosylase 2 family protein [Paracoccaceae bacterium]
MTAGRIIETEADIAEGAAWLERAAPDFAPLLATVGSLPLRRQADGFPALLDAIISQQVSVQSAAAIKAKLVQAGLASEEAILKASDDDLRACGFSRQKIRYAKALAGARLDYAGIRALPDGEVVSTLVAVPGIGRWTAEVYGIIALGRADMFAAGDLALQEAARIAFDLPARPGEREFAAMAEAWRPWRAIAARALWAYYRHVKQRDGIW